jgi:uncharacterized cofD-like protein
LNIVTIGGGSGQFSLLSGLRDMTKISITAVVSMTDSGGSTGRLRDELGILPPGDVVKCIVALSPHQRDAMAILLKRFKADHRLQGHSAGNMLLTIISRYAGCFASGVSALCELLDVSGTVLPVTLNHATLVAELSDGSRIYGEQAIDIPGSGKREKIRDVFLVPHYSDCVQAYPPVLDAIARADVIILGPGDLYTSIIPNLIVPGIAEALKNSRAILCYVLSIMTKYGETQEFTGLDFVHCLESCLHRPLDVIIGNSALPSDLLLEKYAGEKSELVHMDIDSPDWGRRRVHTADLLDTSGGTIRHDPKKLANLLSIVFSKIPQ